MLFQILSTTLLLIIVMGPGGNLPMFVSLLKKQSGEGYRRIVLRESLIALGGPVPVSAFRRDHS